jgi:hypothetical protein
VAAAPEQAHAAQRLGPEHPALVVAIGHVQALVQAGFDAAGRPVWGPAIGRRRVRRAAGSSPGPRSPGGAGAGAGAGRRPVRRTENRLLRRGRLRATRAGFGFERGQRGFEAVGRPGSGRWRSNAPRSARRGRARPNTVAQIVNLLCRRLAVGGASAQPNDSAPAHTSRITNPRYGRLPACATDQPAHETAGGKPALRRTRQRSLAWRRKPLGSAEHRSAPRFAGQLAEQCSALHP